MLKNMFKILFSLILTIFLLYIFISSNVFGVELVVNYGADAGPFVGEKYYMADMIPPSAIFCNGYGEPFFDKRQLKIMLSGTVNGDGVSKDITEPGTYTIWSKAHPECSGSSYSLTATSVSFSGMDVSLVSGKCNPKSCSVPGSVQATGITNYWQTGGDSPVNTHISYIIAEAPANGNIDTNASQPNIAWWNRDQAASYSGGTSYKPTKTNSSQFGTTPKTSAQVSAQIDAIKAQLNTQLTGYNNQLAELNKNLKADQDLLKSLQQTKDDTNATINTLKSQNETLSSQISTLNSEISTLDSEISTLSRKITNCNNDISDLNDTRSDLVDQKNSATTDDAKNAIQDQIDAVDRQISSKISERDGYKNSKSSKETQRSSKIQQRTSKQNQYNSNASEITKQENSINNIRGSGGTNTKDIDQLINSTNEDIKKLQDEISKVTKLKNEAQAKVTQANTGNGTGNSSIAALENMRKALTQVSTDTVDNVEGYSSSDAAGILREAAIFNAMHNGEGGIHGNYKGTITDNTVQEEVKVDYDATAQQYIVGPFNISYMEVYVKQNQFAGVTGTPKLKLNIDGTDVEKELGDGWALAWKDARQTTGTLGDTVPEKYHAYPHTGEDFYLVIDYEDGLNKITGFHLDFRYLTAQGTYELFEGIIEKYQWTVSAPSFTECRKYLGKDDDGNAKYCENNKSAKITVSKSRQEDIPIQKAMRVVNAKRGYEEDEYDFEWDIDMTTTMAGDVWLDVDPQKGNGSSVNGIWEGGENGLDNIAVTVYLYQGSSKIREALFHDEGGGRRSWPIYTSGGHYEINRLEAPGGASNCYYVVEFEYDGQVLKSTVYMSDGGGGEGSASAYKSSPNSYSKSSMAVEEVEDRAKFDMSFGEITGNGSATSGVTHTTGLDGTGASGSDSLEYSAGAGESGMREAKLQSPFRTNSSAVGTRYRMVASTYYNDTNTYGVSVDKEQFRIIYPLESWYYTLNATNTGSQRYIAEYMLHINLGLIERTETDMSLLKDLYKVTLVVNEQKMTKEFNPYGDVSAYNDFLVKLENSRAEGYSLGLYSSDVGYQSYQRYNKAIKAVQDLKDGTELRVYATYIVRVYNNSETNDVEINEITDYFDSTFTLVDSDRYTPIINDDMKRNNTLVAEAPYYRICNVSTSNPWKPTRQENKQGFSRTINGYAGSGDLTWNNITGAGDGLQSSKTNTLTNIKLDNTEYAEIFTTYEVDLSGFLNMTGPGNTSATIDTRSALLGDKYNIAEISNYSTYYSEKDIKPGYYQAYNEGFVSGRVDRDSAPNNVTAGNIKDISSYEDDTFQANMLKISIMINERDMYGYVWEDNKSEDAESYSIKVGNGYRDSGESLISGVEVSLYEVINLGDVNSSGAYDGTYDGLEYYYKVPNQFYNLPKSSSTGINGNTEPTMSSSSEVNDINGNRVNGNYYIYGFLAGDYVVRFDYGKYADDTATVYTDVGVSSTEDIIKYNGQDYENTRFLAELTQGDAINDKFLDLTKETKIGGTDINDLQISKARDNESRRIVVDSYSRNIENDRGEILRDRLASNSEYVNSTQMFAETPIMAIEVGDPQTMVKTKTPSTSTRPNGTNSYNEKTDPNANQILTYRYTIKNVNFGLEKRAETDIKLEKYIDTVVLLKSDEVIFQAYMDENGEVITDHANSHGLDKLTYIPHSKTGRLASGLMQQGFYAIDVESEYMNDLSLLVKYKMKVLNISEVDFTGRLNDYYLSANMERAANGSPTVDLYKLTLDNIRLEELDNQGISTNSTLAEILKWNISNPQLSSLLTSSDLSPSGNIDKTDTLRPEVIVYGRYVGRFYYENRIGASERTYGIKNYVKDTSMADISVTYAEDKVVRTTVDQLFDYIDVNTSLDTEESGIGIENTSWSLADVAVEGDGTITSLRNIISDSAYRVNREGSDRSIYDVKDRKLIRDSSSNIAISHNERVERDSDNRMKYIDDVANNIQSIYNPSMTLELKPQNYNPDESVGTIYIVTRKNTSSEQEANELLIDNLAEVLMYSNPTGRRDVNSVPGNAMVIAKNDGFWNAGFNSVLDYERGDYLNWTVYPENDAYATEYITIIPPTGIGLMSLIRTNITQIAGLIMVMVAMGVIFGIKQKKIVNNHDEF